MSSSALFDEDSSDDEEFDPSKQDDTKDEETPKRIIETEESSSSEDERNVGKEDDMEEKEGKPKEKSSVDLFGEDSDDSDDVADANEKEGDESTKKSKPSNSGLFGDDSDDDDEGEAKLDDIVGAAAPALSAKSEQATFQHQDGYDDTRTGSIAVQKPPEKATVLESVRPSEDLTLHMTKLPNLVAIQPAAFEEGLHVEHEEEEQYKGYVQNMIRWRYKRTAQGELERDEKGQLIRESNSRIVQWSDGSFTLHIGKEVFDVHTTDSSTGGFAGLNGYVYLSQKATFSNEGTDEETAGGTVLECMAPVSSRFVPKPSSLQSEAHKSLTVAVRQRTIKKARIAEHVTFEDPEKAKATRIRNKEDLEKATARKSLGSRSGGSRYRRPDMSRGYLEEDEDGDYDTTNIRALKKSNLDDDMDDYGDESDDDGFDDTFRGRKRARNQEESDEEELVVDESDEEQGTLVKAHSSSKRKSQAVVDDDDDDDDE
jgi:RNA polymerase-associated protein LEO1